MQALHFSSSFPGVAVVTLSYFRTTMVVPLFKAFNGGIFVTKGHANHLKWVSVCQSSKKLGKNNAVGKNMIYNAVDYGLWQGHFVEILQAAIKICGNMFQSICCLPRKPELVIHGKQAHCLVTLAHFLMCFHLSIVLQ